MKKRDSKKSDKKSLPKNKSQRAPVNVFLGLDFFVWMKILFGHFFHVGCRYVPLAVSITFVSMINTLLRWLEHSIFGKKIAATEIKEPPLFIIGHWRSGTTMLHELLGLDKRHRCPTTYECFLANHFILTDRLIKPLLNLLVPSRRVQDNMSSDLNSPQEDEIGIGVLGAPTPYLSIAFPNQRRQFMDCFDLEELGEGEQMLWERTMVYFFKKLTFSKPRRIIVKSPTHTFRIKILLKLFPEARFVHLVRDPYRVFQSTVHMWKSVSLSFGLQTPDFKGLEEYVFEMFIRMYEKFEETRSLIPPSHFYELHYEDLVNDPVGEMKNLYENLGLGGFELQFLPALKGYLADTADYKTNPYNIV